MSHQQKPSVKRNTTRDIVALKGVRPIVCLTAYTAPVARAADMHCDLVLVGDSLGMVLYGMDSTVPVSLDLMVNHGRAVVKATEKALVVVDMPFGSYQESAAQAFRNAVHIMKETGATAVKEQDLTEVDDPTYGTVLQQIADTTAEATLKRLLPYLVNAKAPNS